MRTVRIKASELCDVDVDLISLVKRPASRIPFSIIKSEDAKGGLKMFDLAQVFARKSEGSAPVVTSVLVKGEASAQLLALLTEQGFSVEKSETQDGVTVYPQDVAYEGEVSVVKLSESLALTVPVVKSSGSFSEMCAARGFYPSLSIATDLLSCELHRAVEKADSPAAASAKVQAVVSDFGSFMSSLVGALPTVVFKAEAAIAKAEETPAEPAAEAPAAEAPAAEVAADPETAQVAAVPGGDAQPAPTTETTPPAETVATPIEGQDSTAPAHEGPNPIVDHTVLAEAPADPAPPTEVEPTNPGNLNEANPDYVEGQPGIERVAKDELAGIIAAALAPMTEAITGLQERINGIETGVAKAEEKFGAQVFGGVFQTDRDHEDRVSKTEEYLPFLDSGFNHRRD